MPSYQMTEPEAPWSDLPLFLPKMGVSGLCAQDQHPTTLPPPQMPHLEGRLVICNG